MPFDMGYPLRYMLTALRDDHWKHVRSTLTPTFSTGKLRRVCSVLCHKDVNESNETRGSNFCLSIRGSEFLESFGSLRPGG